MRLLAPARCSIAGRISSHFYFLRRKFMTALKAKKTTSPTSQLAQFASALRFEDLPAQVVAKAKTCILDTLGCCLFGSTLEPVRKLTTFVASEACGDQATVFGST